MKSGKNIVCLLVCLSCIGMAPAAICNFDDLTLAAGSYWNGSDSSGGFTSGDAYFINTFTDWGGGVTSWDGFAYSNMTDTTTPGFTNECSAIAGGGAGGSTNYGIGYVGWSTPPTVQLNTAGTVQGAHITNTTYAYLAMLNGEGPASAFGEEDWFKLTIEGFDAGSNSTGTVDFMLANGRDILDGWAWVDLTGLGNAVASLQFTLTSTDNDPLFGMNTPAYFAIDNLTVVPEPATMLLLGIGGLLLRRKSA